MILLDKLKNKIKYNKKIMIFLIIIVIFGIISGSFLSVMLNNNDKELVIDNINEYIKNINTFQNMNILKNSLFSNLIIITCIWILGISIIGIIIVIILVFWKSFTLGFTISSFILTYNFKGILLSFIYIFPHLIINILITMYLGSYAFKFSLLLIKCITNKIKLDFRKLIFIYFKVLITSIVVIIFTSFFEAFITPIFLKYIVQIILK